jgi:ATPase subunit of ABC transporter with duplicated ATPase domains
LKIKKKLLLLVKNGEGKTTLMRILHHELQHTTGNLHRGEMVKIGYYAQIKTYYLDSKKNGI